MIFINTIPSMWYSFHMALMNVVWLLCITYNKPISYLVGFQKFVVKLLGLPDYYMI